MRKVVIFEPETEGHRLHFVGIIADALHERGIDYVLALRRGARNTLEGRSHLRELPSGCEIVDLEDFSHTKSTSSIAKQWKQQLGATIERTKPTDVFIPTADLLAHWVGLTGLPKTVRENNVRMHALMMRGTFAYKLNHRLRSIRAFVTERLLMRTRWSTLSFLDPIVVDRLHAAYPRSAQIVRNMPEPIEELPKLSRSQARAQLGVPQEGRIIACAGRMNLRKGIDTLIEAFVAAKRLPTDRLLLVGKQEQSISNILKELDRSLFENQQIIARDQFAEDSQFGAIFRAADVIAVPYPQHIGSSGILLRAAKSENSILASDWGWVGWVTNTFDLGNAVKVSNAAEFANAIALTLNQSTDFESSSSSRALLQYHTIQNFQAHWLRNIDGALGSGLIQWESVPHSERAKRLA